MTKEFEQQVITFLENISKSEKGAISPATELIDSGIVDSLSIVNLITFLEQQTQSEIRFEDVDLDDFRTVANIAARFCGSTAHSV